MKIHLGFAVIGCALLLMTACKSVVPAEAQLLGCDAVATALDTLSEPVVFAKLSDADVATVTQVRDDMKPRCSGSAPDVNMKAKDAVPVDAAAHLLKGIIAKVKGS